MHPIDKQQSNLIHSAKKSAPTPPIIEKNTHELEEVTSEQAPSPSASKEDASKTATPGAVDSDTEQNPKQSGDGEGEQHEDAGSAAFNPETGEINWDCPCLGGMAHGPCGMEFREAFSCFVYSEQEPKGIDCVEKFKGMQDCFRAHPETYGEGELGLDCAGHRSKYLMSTNPRTEIDDDEAEASTREVSGVHDTSEPKDGSIPQGDAISAPAPEPVHPDRSGSDRSSDGA